MAKGPLLLATLEYPPQVGGIATYLSNMVHALPDGRAVVLAPRHPEAHAWDAARSYPVYRRRLLSGLLRPRWLPALFWCDWAVRRERPSAMVVSHLLPMGTVARLMKRRHGTPYAVIVHGMDVALALDSGGRRLAEARQVLGDAALVVANSSFTRALALSAGAPSDRLMVVHPPPSFTADTEVDAGTVRRVREERGLGHGFVLLSVGRLVERKGFDTAIQAVSMLRRRGQDVTLVVAGDGPDRLRLEGIAIQEGVLEHVRFLGPVSGTELASLYAACDAFCMVPRSIGPDVEGFGIVYLDAATFAKPAIGSRTGGVPEAVVDGETGTLVPPSDVPALAAAIKAYMDDRTLAARHGYAGRERVRRMFDPRLIARPLIERLERL